MKNLFALYTTNRQHTNWQQIWINHVKDFQIIFLSKCHIGDEKMID